MLKQQMFIIISWVSEGSECRMAYLVESLIGLLSSCHLKVPLGLETLLPTPSGCGQSSALVSYLSADLVPNCMRFSIGVVMTWQVSYPKASVREGRGDRKRGDEGGRRRRGGRGSKISCVGSDIPSLLLYVIDHTDQHSHKHGKSPHESISTRRWDYWRSSWRMAITIGLDQARRE